MLRELEKEEFNDLLDCGCGPAPMLTLLHDKYPDKYYTGIDLTTEKGIYSYVRNPMYSGWWILLSGIILMWHNWVMLILPVIDWVIMTIALMYTEEKWLLDLYGDGYADYKKRVNRFIPWKRS